MRWFFACLALTAYCTASPGPSSLPLLKSKGLGVGVGFSDDSNNATVKSASEKAYADLLSAGLDVIQIAFTWKTLETSPGVYDISTWTGLMKICSETGLAPLVNWPAIDTDVLAVPSDLVDPNDPSRLRPGLNFNSSEVVDRYCSMARALLPPTIAAGASFLFFSYMHIPCDFLCDRRVLRRRRERGVSSTVVHLLPTCLCAPYLISPLIRWMDI